MQIKLSHHTIPVYLLLLVLIVQILQINGTEWIQIPGTYEAARPDFDNAETTCLKYSARLPQIEKDSDILDIWYTHLVLHRDRVSQDANFPGWVLGHKFEKSSRWTNRFGNTTKNEYLNKKNETELMIPNDLLSGCLFLRFKNGFSYDSNLWELKADDCSKISEKFIICALPSNYSVVRNHNQIQTLTENFAKMNVQLVQLQKRMELADFMEKFTYELLMKNQIYYDEVKEQIESLPGYLSVIFVSLIIYVLLLVTLRICIRYKWISSERFSFLFRISNLTNSAA